MEESPGSTDPLLFQKVPEGLLMVPNNSLQRYQICRGLLMVLNNSLQRSAGGTRSAEVCLMNCEVCDMTIVPSLREGNSGHISYSLNCVGTLF